LERPGSTWNKFSIKFFRVLSGVVFMKGIHSVVRSVGFILITILIASCGGGGGGGGDGAAAGNVKTGAFIDSAVQGLSYSTATQSGLTNAAGEFKYRDGEVVTFKIGNIEIGSAFGAEYLSPLDITNSYLPVDTEASNVARLLQTLDTDSNPDNGITLPATIAVLDSTLDISDTTAVEAAISKTLVAAVDAEDHLETSLAAFPPRAVDDRYVRVTIGATGLTGCPNIVDAEIAVSRDVDGNRVYDGTITLFGGGQYLFTADDSTIRNPAILDDPDHKYLVTLNTHVGAISIFTLGQPSIQTECGEVILTTDTAVNLPPIVRNSSNVVTYPSCTSASSTYNITPHFYGFDRDGFIASDITAKFAIDGAPLTTTLVNPGITSSCANPAAHMTWNPKPQGNGGWYCAASNPILENIPCSSYFSWEVSATDNEGLTTTITGGNTAPQSGGGPVSGDILQCHENYPSEACDILIGQALPGLTVTRNSVGSCASLVPEPRNIISATQTPPESAENLIVNYDSFGVPEVSCLVAIDIP
jgi:hypothetical protein